VVRTVGRRVLAAALAVLVLLAVVGFGWPRLASWLAGTTEPGNSLLTSSADDIARARRALAEWVLVERPGPAPDYRRSAFGKAWEDVDGNGCNQRDDVLLRDLRADRPHALGRQGSCAHDVLAGTWVDPYTGAEIVLTDAKQRDQAQSVQIDHVVPLLVAWRYGARDWTDAERLRFANDLANLVAAGGAANQAKGGSDAAAWRPVRAAQCGYAVRYVLVKQAYGLAGDAAEKSALARMLETCP
jgi:uncharacterized protein DUF1524